MRGVRVIVKSGCRDGKGKKMRRDCSRTSAREPLRTYAEVVNTYIKLVRNPFRQELDFYASQPSLQDAVRNASLAIPPAGSGRMIHSHQARVAKQSLQEAYQKLRDEEFSECTDFEKLFSKLKALILPIHGIGRLTLYDIALRIGAYLGFEPERIYLHRGAREGANAIGVGIRKGTIELHAIPAQFQLLRPCEIEDCFCCYKHELKGIGNT